jgi:hypothetical protein
MFVAISKRKCVRIGYIEKVTSISAQNGHAACYKLPFESQKLYT